LQISVVTNILFKLLTTFLSRKLLKSLKLIFVKHVCTYFWLTYQNMEECKEQS